MSSITFAVKHLALKDNYIRVCKRANSMLLLSILRSENMMNDQSHSGLDYSVRDLMITPSIGSDKLENFFYATELSIY